jgi:hypothetical protein
MGGTRLAWRGAKLANRHIEANFIKQITGN